MSDFWNGLSARERWFVIAGAGLAGVLVVAQLLVSPILGWRSDRSDAAARARNAYELVARAASLSGGATMQDAAEGSEEPIRNAVTGSARAAGVQLNFVNTRPDGAVEANAAATDPAVLFKWLGEIQTRYGIRLSYADIAREPGETNAVRARMIFVR